MTTVSMLTNYIMLVPIATAILSITSRNPVNAILGLIATFLVASGLIFHQYSLGFTCALIIIVYIGAIAVLFLFIIMLIPIKERPILGHDFKHYGAQFAVLFAFYAGGGHLLMNSLVDDVMKNNSVFGVQPADQLDYQEMLPLLANSELEKFGLQDLYNNDIAIFGAELYQNGAFAIMLVGVILLYVLVAAIVLCQEE